MAVLDIIFLAAGIYNHPIWQIIQMLIYNISYAWALYCLAVFYLAVKKVISSFRPMAKFSTVKAVVFATYYQSLILRFALSKPSTAVDWNNFMLAMEMVMFSMAFMIAFPVEEFLGGIPHRRVLRNVKEVFTFRDIFQNIYYNFNPDYQDYALQSSQTEVPSTIHADTNTMMMTGNLSRVAKEMTERYRGRSQKKSFNAVLRGGNPITAKIRRYRDRGGGLGSNHSSQNSLLSATDGCESEGLEGVQIATEKSSVRRHHGETGEGVVYNRLLQNCDGDGKRDDVMDLEGGLIREQGENDDSVRNSAIGRLPLKLRPKPPNPAPNSSIIQLERPVRRPRRLENVDETDNEEWKENWYDDQSAPPASMDIEVKQAPSSLFRATFDDPESGFSPIRSDRRLSQDPFNSPSVEWTEYMDFQHSDESSH